MRLDNTDCSESLKAGFECLEFELLLLEAEGEGGGLKLTVISVR